jgi:hypothetical protein
MQIARPFGWTAPCFFTKLIDEGTATFSPRSRLLTAQGHDGVKRLLRPEKPERANRETKTMAYARNSQFRAPSGRTIFDWLTGTGFLAVDAGAFFVALMVLLPWNLYSAPGDLWVAQPLRSWAFILTFHALVVGAIALARGIVRSSEPETIVPQRGLRASSAWSAPAETAPRSTRATASALIAQEWARRWLDDDRAEVAEMMQQSESISARRSDVPSDQTAHVEITPWPDAPESRAQSLDAEAILDDWLDEQASEYVAPAPERVDPLRSAARVSQEDTIELEPELEWKWVEAAASAWLSKRDVSPNGHADSNGHA